MSHHGPRPVPAQDCAALPESVRPRPRLTALIVHIHQEPMDLMQTVLERLGVRVLCSKTPREGLALMETHRPDLIIHNYQMPLIDGEAFDRKIRRRWGPRRPAIIWVSMTHLKPGHVASWGVNAWLKSGFSEGEFASFIRPVLAAAEATTIQCSTDSNPP